MLLQAPHFIGWSTQLAQGVAAALLKSVKGTPIDLGSHRVIVPSSFASRLIQEELAKQSPNGVLLPAFQTPTEFLNWGDANAQVATEADALIAWIEVLRNIDRNDYQNLFPLAQDVGLDHQEAQRLAQTLFELRDELGGSAQGLDFADVANLPDNPEKARWEDLARLEQGYRDLLEARGLRDHNDLRAELALGDEVPAGVSHIWLAGLTDPQPLFITAMERLKEHFEVQVIVGADPVEAGNFDAWGRAIPAVWKDRRSDWPDYAESVHVVGDAPEALKKLRNLLGDVTPVDGVHAVCACDREIDAPKIAALIHSLGADAVNPLGTAHGAHALHHALRTWSHCLAKEEPDFGTVRKVLHIPELVRLTTGGATVKAFDDLNTQLDTADAAMLRGPISEVAKQIKNLPEPTDAREHIGWEQLQQLPERFETLGKLREIHLAKPWREAMEDFIHDLTKPLRLREEDPDDAFTLEVAETLHTVALEIEAAAAESELALSHQQLIALTLDAASTQRHRRSDAKEAVNLPGWVEAPWDPVPHLVLFGLNDHLIPRAKHAHPFLPAKLRELAGLPTNEQIFAGAAFTLEQLRRRRAGHGWLDVIVPQQDADGNPLRPSRLLFQTDDEALIQRVSHLFADAPNNEAQPYWEIPDAHKFVPLASAKQASKVVESISPTAFKMYLADPAEFWLKRALGMDEQSLGSLELDAAGFGNLAHGALEMFGNEQLGKSLADEDEIRRQLSLCLDQFVRGHFGANPPTAIRLQQESARARLSAFATTQAMMAGEGWVIKKVEGEFELTDDKLPADRKLGMKVKGKFDRLDHHPGTGEWRVFDYKTFSYHKNPTKTHFGKAALGDLFVSTVPKRKQDDTQDGVHCIRWKDLQLPVYHFALRNLPKDWPEIAQDQKLHLGYLCLPARAKDARVEIWQHYETDHRDKAEETIKAVIGKIKAGGPDNFAPSPEGSDYPVLKALNGRPMHNYLNVGQLGGTRS
jgi:ATP-dependent helicase/nuclease subunit B